MNIHLVQNSLNATFSKSQKIALCKDLVYKSWKDILEKWMFLQKGFQPILVSLKSLLWLPNFWEKSSLLPKVERWQDERSAENYNGLPHSTDRSFLRSCYLVGFNKNFLSCSNLWKCKGFFMAANLLTHKNGSDLMLLFLSRLLLKFWSKYSSHRTVV